LENRVHRSLSISVRPTTHCLHGGACTNNLFKAVARNISPVLPRLAVASNPLVNRVQQILTIKGLREKFQRPCLHGPHRHGNIAATRDENDRDSKVGFS
jgi:hypothetical protein